MTPEEQQELATILSIPLADDNGHHLREQMSILGAWLYRVGHALNQAKELLAKAENQMLMPKSSGLTDIDRKIQLASAVRTEQFAVDEYKMLADSISALLSMGQSMLKSIGDELKGGLRT